MAQAWAWGWAGAMAWGLGAAPAWMASRICHSGQRELSADGSRRFKTGSAACMGLPQRIASD